MTASLSWSGSPTVLNQPRLVVERGAYEEVDGVDLVGEVSGLEQCLAIRADAGLTLSVAETHENLGALPVVTRGRAVGQFERFGVPPDGFVGSELLDRPPGRDERVVDRFGAFGRLHRGSPVVGEFTGPFARVGADDRLELLGNRMMGSRCRAGESPS